MKRSIWFYFLSACTVVMWVSIVSAQSSGEDTELNLGIRAFKQNKFEQAIFHFEKAVAEDPSNVHAHLYLATAYAQGYIGGVDLPDNKKIGENAIEQYKKVMELNPPIEEMINAVKGAAYLELQMKKFDEAREGYRKIGELDPQDQEAYYSVAVIDWTESYQLRMEERMKINLNADASLPAKDPNVCATVRAKNWDRVQEGIDDLIKAIQVRPDFDDAMAYLNLMYRERADIQCFDAAARKADLKTADDWVDKVMATKKAKAEKEDAVRPAPNQ